MPEPAAKSRAIGSWSLNGNHDMYAGGHGYFDTLLRQSFMLRWHGDERGEPSSFFLIEDADWQVFGLDTSWNLPSLGSAVFGQPTLKDYGGQNGWLNREQVDWMARQRKPAKGCILLTHHQPASSRTTESQHADEAVALLKSAGVYAQIDAWIWGHEHRGVVFKPKAERTVVRLKDAPDFCSCLGHGGIPVTRKNLEASARVADVLWEEDRLDPSTPLYEGERIVPFGFGRIDVRPGAFTFRIFDHAGEQRYRQEVLRSSAVAPLRRVGRGMATPLASTPAKVSKTRKTTNQKPSIQPLPAVKKTTSKTTPKDKPAALADWTILIYMAGDNDLNDFGGDDLQEMKKIGSSDRINVLVQRDTSAAGEPTRRYRARRGTPPAQDVVQELGETNTGDPKVLADFLRWGLTTYPAQRTMAILWNHGNGWDDTDIYAEARKRGLNPPAARSSPGGGPRRSGVRGRPILPGGFVQRSAARKRFRGPFFLTAFKMDKRRAIAFDDDAQDFLDSVEMKKVFLATAKAAGRKFDVIGMDACLMSMVETGLQVQKAGEVFCGSQEVEPGQGWPYDGILRALSAKSGMMAEP